MINKKNMISDNTVTRLSYYLRQLKMLKADGVTRISSGMLGSIMGYTASQIRQDFSCFGTFGQQGYGYSVDTLITEITQILGLNRNYKAVLLGTGNIGMALLEHFDFASSGIQVAAAFDVDERVIGKEINGIMVMDAHTLNEYCRKNSPDIAINCVSADSAQRATDHAVEAGVKAIWNFTNVYMKTKPNIIMENLFFSDSIQHLEYYLTDMVDNAK